MLVPTGSDCVKEEDLTSDFLKTNHGVCTDLLIKEKNMCDQTSTICSVQSLTQVWPSRPISFNLLLLLPPPLNLFNNLFPSPLHCQTT